MTTTSAVTWANFLEFSVANICRVSVVLRCAPPNGWLCRVPPLLDRERELPGIAPDDVLGAQAAALKMAAEILKPYAEAYSVIAEERMG